MLEGRQGVIFGVANKRSLAYACARAAADAGARLVLTYQGERFASGVEQLAASLPDATALECDVASDESLERAFERLGDVMPRVDFALHSIAYARREELEGRFADTSRGGFGASLDVSAYSLTALARRLAPRMTDGGSLVAMTYVGAERVVPHYNVMGVAKAALEASVRYLAADLGPQGVRVNAISAGAVRTLASSGIAGFTRMLDIAKERAPLRRPTDPAEVADATVFLLSDRSRGITGTTLYVDGGLHVMAI